MEIFPTKHKKLRLRAALQAKRETGFLRLIINPEKQDVTISAEETEWFTGVYDNGKPVPNSKTIPEMANYLMSFNKTQLIKVILELVTIYLEIPLNYDSEAGATKKYKSTKKRRATAKRCERARTKNKQAA